MAHNSIPNTVAADIVTFRVCDMLCGLDIVDVQEIKRVHQITAVHRAPPEVRGVVNMRGRIVTIIDVRQKLGFTPAGDGPALVIIVPHRDELLGLLVDDVDDIVRAEPGTLAPAPANLKGVERELFCGVLKLDLALVAILDRSRVVEQNASTRPTQ
jgi:purine-binding chemotaxis protein CheW